MSMYTGLARIARRTGYPVIEVQGWEKRTRPQLMSDVRTITCHHTANGGAKGDYPSYNTVLNGRGSDLPGPLAQYGIGRSGTIYVFAAGSANHAGESRSVNYEKIHAIGIEAEAVGIPGTPGDWPEAQMDSYAKLCKALVEEFSLDISDVRGHKETCFPVGRKSDPSFNMDSFRSRVSRVKLPDELEEEDDMKPSDRHTLTEADAAAFGDPSLEGETKSYDELWRFPPSVARLRREQDADTKATNAKLDAIIAALSANGIAVKAKAASKKS